MHNNLTSFFRNKYGLILTLTTSLLLNNLSAMQGGVSKSAVKLIVHPENSRYFEYKGKPLVMFLDHGGLNSGSSGNFIYQPSGASDGRIKRVAEHGNHMYMHVNRGFRDVDWRGAVDMMSDQSRWDELERVCKTAYEHDVMLSLVFWSYKWNFLKQDWSGSDMIHKCNDAECTTGFDGDDSNDVVWLDDEILPGFTKRDLHLLAIDKVVEACWPYPNATFNMMWEYNVRIGSDRNGHFHRWWVKEMRAAAQRHYPGSSVSHLFSIEYGGEHPSVRDADFITEEDGNGFWKSGADFAKVKSYNVPLVFWASDWSYEDEVGTAIGPVEYREQVREGFNPAEAFAPPTDEGLEYTLQARWYLENTGFDTEVAKYSPSRRPKLSTPPGYNNGVKVVNGALDFACVYSDPEGDPPTHAEVWVDRNGDGRFAIDPSKGERIAMNGSGSDYRNGVTFSASNVTVQFSGNRDLSYVFRFADTSWNPPQSGGLVPGNNSGISYNHWTIADFRGEADTEPPNKPTGVRVQ